MAIQSNDNHPGKKGRPAKNDPQTFIDELWRRYPQGSPFSSMTDFQNANTDISGIIKSMANKGKEYFGMPLGKYLLQIGILKPKTLAVPSEEDTEMFALLRSKIGETPFHGTVSDLEKAFPEIKFNLIAAYYRKSRTSLSYKEFLQEQGILAKEDPQTELQKITDSLRQRYPDPRSVPESFLKLQQMNPDLPVKDINKYARSVFNETPEEYLRRVGVVPPAWGKRITSPFAAKGDRAGAFEKLLNNLHERYGGKNPKAVSCIQILRECGPIDLDGVRSFLSDTYLTEHDLFNKPNYEINEMKDQIFWQYLIEDGILDGSQYRVKWYNYLTKDDLNYLEGLFRPASKSDLTGKTIVVSADSLTSEKFASFAFVKDIISSKVNYYILDIFTTSLKKLAKALYFIENGTDITFVDLSAFCKAENLPSPYRYFTPYVMYYTENKDDFLLYKTKVISYAGQDHSVVIPEWMSDISGICLPPEIQEITINNFSHTIPEGVFAGLKELRMVRLPQRLMSIGSGCFKKCEKLETIEIPDGVTRIGREVFFECRNLKSICIPASLETIGDEAFWGCSALEKVYYSGSESDRQKIQMGKYNGYLENACWTYGG